MRDAWTFYIYLKIDHIAVIRDVQCQRIITSGELFQQQ